MMESVAFEYLFWANVLRSENMPVNQMIGTGGGSKSPLWNQIKADIMNVDYMIPSHSEGAVMGNALLAAYGVGDIKDMKATIKDWVSFTRTFHPNPEMTKFYHELAKVREEILNGPLLEIFNHIQALHDRLPLPSNG
jgi:xylulokinase